MEELVKAMSNSTLDPKVFKKTKMSDKTIRSYANKVYDILKSVEGGIADNKCIIDKLLEYDTIMNMLNARRNKRNEPLSKGTIKNKIMAIHKILTILDKDADIRKQYMDNATELSNLITQDYDKSEKSVKQQDNWCMLKDLQTCIEENKSEFETAVTTR